MSERFRKWNGWIGLLAAVGGLVGTVIVVLTFVNGMDERVIRYVDLALEAEEEKIEACPGQRVPVLEDGVDALQIQADVMERTQNHIHDEVTAIADDVDTLKEDMARALAILEGRP